MFPSQTLHSTWITLDNYSSSVPMNEAVIWRMTDFANEAIWNIRRSLNFRLRYPRFKYQSCLLIAVVLTKLCSFEAQENFSEVGGTQLYTAIYFFFLYVRFSSNWCPVLPWDNVIFWKMGMLWFHALREHEASVSHLLITFPFENYHYYSYSVPTTGLSMKRKAIEVKIAHTHTHKSFVVLLKQYWFQEETQTVAGTLYPSNHFLAKINGFVNRSLLL